MALIHVTSPIDAELIKMSEPSPETYTVTSAGYQHLNEWDTEREYGKSKKVRASS